MKLTKLLPMLALLFMMVACGEKKTEEAEEGDMVVQEKDTWDADKAMTDWRDAWNKNDAKTLESVTADDVTLFINGKSHTQDSVTSWIEESSSWMKDLKTTSVMKKKGDNIAYEAGTYMHGTKENDSLKMAGTYTVIWERDGDNEWVIKLMDISPEMDSMPPMPKEQMPKK